MINAVTAVSDAIEKPAFRPTRRIRKVAGIVEVATATTIMETGKVDHAGLGVNVDPIIPPNATSTNEPVAEISWQNTRMIKFRNCIPDAGHTLIAHFYTIGDGNSVCICSSQCPYNAHTMIFDLHTHTTASDGAMTPTELILFAEEQNVGCLAITDHDTLGAYDQLDSATSQGLKLVVGLELSTTWQGHGIHIIGLNVDPHNAALKCGIRSQQDARLSRASTIATRLQKTGIDDPLPAVKRIAGDSVIGRPHFARHLVDIGHSKDISAAFRKYLGNGKIGDVKQCWQAMPEVVDWIRTAGGTPVLAHPAKYRMTWTKLRALIEDFADAGGQAIEVVSGSQEPNITKKLAILSHEFELAASCGSDFHQLSSWSAPGKFPPLPDSVTKVWDLW